MEEKELFVSHTINKYAEQDEGDPEFFSHKRHIFVFTMAGKPVYSRYGDEMKLSSFIASLSTIIQKLCLPPTKDEGQSDLRYFENDNTRTVVIMRQKLYFMIMTKDKSDSIPYLTNILEFLNIQLISLITNMINVTLEKKPSYSPTGLLSGTNTALGVAIKNAVSSPGYFLHSFMASPLNNSIRSQVTNILKEKKHPECLHTILLSPVSIFSYVKQKGGADLQPYDFLLIFNLIHSSQSLRQSESWVPLCLPGISSAGFIYAYVYFYNKNIGIVMVTSTTTTEMFLELSKISKNIQDELISTKLMLTLNNSLTILPYGEDVVGIKPLKHFIIQSLTLNQYTMPKWHAFGQKSKELKKLNKTYCELYDKYLQSKPMKKREFTQIEQREGSLYAIYANKEFCILMQLNQLEGVTTVSHAITALMKWIKQEETNYFLKRAS